jgi:hypothetical protein
VSELRRGHADGSGHAQLLEALALADRLCAMLTRLEEG